MTEARRRCAAGDFPRQHLWGADTLERRGHTVEYGPFAASERLAPFTRRTRSRLGYLDEELGMLRAAGRGDVLFAGGPDITRGLAWLRRARGLRTPLASVFHGVGTVGPWVRGLDVAFCLSERGRRRLVDEHGRDPARTVALPWGPDLEFPLYRSTGDQIVVSAGRTNRDVGTLVEALSGGLAAARVYAPAGTSVRGSGDVEVIEFDATNQHWVLDDFARASVIAIPLADPQVLSGLSELNDALGLAKPVIVTRSPEIDVDVEAVGCGRWVERGDVAGWRAALDELLSDAPLRRAMGERGRAWARERWNSDLFGRGVADALEQLT
jgi:glycosyltransferase involved in cell wall biosynthesis